MRDLGWLWHLLGGAAITAILTSLSDSTGVVDATVDLFLFGWIRESSQHDWEMSLHRWTEALAWPAGALLYAGVRALL